MNYQRIYDSIINKAKSQNRVKSKDTYYEAHHIVPVCLGGEGKTSHWKSHPNIVLLTGREHFLAHWLLHEIYPDNHKLARAFVMMCKVKDSVQQRYTPSSRIIEYARIVHINYSRGQKGFWKDKHLSEEAKDKLRLCNLGRKHTDETKQKMSRSRKGKSANPYAGSKISAAKKGVIFSEDHRDKLSKAKIGKPWSQKQWEARGLVKKEVDN
jgi:hypothetical protein